MSYLVLGVKKYNFKQDNGQMVSGTTITYCDEPTYDENNKGFSPMKITAPLEEYHVFNKVPALYDMEFRLKPNAQGKATLEYIKATFKKEVQLPLLNG